MKAYEVFSATAIGDSHIRKGIPREDNVGDLGTEAFQLMAVSDGHGDPNCFRSAKGSEIAVRVCLDGLREFAEHYLYDSAFRSQFEIQKYKDEVITRLTTGIEAQWNLQVQADLERHPICYGTETEGCDSDKIRRYQRGEKLKNIYGATLIGAAVFDNLILVLQLGDGKAVFLESDGHFSQPVPPDPRCRGNITTSLCDEDALQSFRVHCREFSYIDKPPAVFLTSDGIEDSYRTDDLMYCFHRDLCIHAAQEGILSVKKRYEQEILCEISRDGSGDDMSVAAFLDLERIRPLTAQMAAQNQNMSLQEDARYYLERMQSMEMKRKFLRRDLEKAEEALHGTNAKLLPNNQVITDYQSQKQGFGKALADLNAVIETCSREKISREKELAVLQTKLQEAEKRLAEYGKVLEDLQDPDNATEIAAVLRETVPGATGEIEAESLKISEEKVRASFEQRRGEKQRQCDALRTEIESMAHQIEPIEVLIAKYEEDILKASEGKTKLTEQIRGLDEKIDGIILENRRLSGDSQSKEQIYAKKKQEWLDYEEKYKAYEAKYNALMKQNS